MEKRELKYWLAWNKVKLIGPIRFLKLVELYSSLEKAWYGHLNESMVKKTLRIGDNTIRRIEEEKAAIDPDEELELLKETGAKVITILNAEYPESLRNIYDPPPVLYYRGDFIKATQTTKRIAIVGSRKATYYGRKVSKEIAGKLALSGYTVISGLARGIDTYAHAGCLEADGKTIAVMGCGVNHIYPRENQKIANKIIQNGAIISEFPILAGPEKSHFPRRNRIISGLSAGVLIVEADVKSGALITADFALDQGREVFAVPGSVYSYLSRGCHNLLRQGARLVESCEDILTELGDQDQIKNISRNNQLIQTQISFELKKDKELSVDENNVLNCLSIEPLCIDEILELSKLTVSQLSQALLSLEIKNMIKEIEGKRYVRL